MRLSAVADNLIDDVRSELVHAEGYESLRQYTFTEEAPVAIRSRVEHLLDRKVSKGVHREFF